MSMLFKNHSYLSPIYVHNELPLIDTIEFDFYRCVNVSDWVYGKTISQLHAGNLRENNKQGRYSKLFPNERISYWADSKCTALAEIKKHGGNKDYLTFWAYDDASSTFPILNNEKGLVIINGKDLNFHEILLKIEKDEKLSTDEIEVVEKIKREKPDCLAYKSVAYEGGTNFLFFEKGFRKLALREIILYFGERKSKNTNIITCASTCDYSPHIKSYGMYFKPIAGLGMDSEYEETKEYKEYSKNFDESFRQFQEFHKRMDGEDLI